MVKLTCSPPHPALAAAFDPALLALRHVAAALSGSAVRTEAVPGQPADAPRRRWSTRRAAARCAGLSVQDLGNLDIEHVARWLTGHYEKCANRDPYPGVVIGSTNGAMVQLCTLTRMPWLPQTIMLPLWWEPRCSSSLPAAAALGVQAATAFHGRNPEVELYQTHDGQIAPNEWIGAVETWRAPQLRAKLRRLPRAYAIFLTTSLACGAPVILLHDESAWPTTRLGDRHVLQVGSRRTPTGPEWSAAGNGTGLQRSGWADTLIPDALSPDAEWGYDPDVDSDIERWCAGHGHPLYRVRIRGPHALSSAAAEIQRQCARHRGRASSALACTSGPAPEPVPDSTPVSGVLDVLRVVGRTGVTVTCCINPTTSSAQCGPRHSSTVFGPVANRIRDW